MVQICVLSSSSMQLEINDLRATLWTTGTWDPKAREKLHASCNITGCRHFGIGVTSIICKEKEISDKWTNNSLSMIGTCEHCLIIRICMNNFFPSWYWKFKCLWLQVLTWKIDRLFTHVHLLSVFKIAVNAAIGDLVSVRNKEAENQQWRTFLSFLKTFSTIRERERMNSKSH